MRKECHSLGTTCRRGRHFQLSRVVYPIKTERRQASHLPAFFAADLCNRRGVFLLRALELFIAGSAAFKSRRRKTTRQIVRRGKLHGFRVVNHARPIAELISVPLTDDHLYLRRRRLVGGSR